MSSGSRGAGRGRGQAGANQRRRGWRKATPSELGLPSGGPTGDANQQEDDGNGAWTVVERPRRRSQQGGGRGNANRGDAGRGYCGRQALTGGQGVSSAQTRIGQSGGDQGPGDQKPKKGLIAFKKDPAPCMKGYDDKRSVKDDRRNIAPDLSPWSLTKGPTSTIFGSLPVATRETGSSKGKGKGKAEGQREGVSIEITLRAERPGLVGEVIEAVEVDDPALEIPVPSPPPSFISARPSSRPRTQSEESVVSFHSEVVYDRMGQQRYFLKNPNPEAREKFYQQIAAMYNNSNARMLNLVPGQGGTFGFGEWYRTERGREPSGEQQVIDHPDITKHLSFFNKRARRIGTVKCVSCTGVYFEIKGNRCFAAHIDTWHNEDRFDCRYPQKDDAEWKEIVSAVVERLGIHSREYRWTPKDVYKETLCVVCPLPEAQAYAVPEALKMFLGLEKRPYVQMAHGFIMCPGVRHEDDGGPIVHLLEVKYGVKNEETGELEAVRDTFPKTIDRVAYKHSNNDHVLEQWCYTVGQKWHHVEPYYDSRFGRRIHVEQGTTIQTFARPSYIYLDGKEVKTNVVRDEDYKKEEAPGAKWRFTDQFGKPIVLDGFDP